MIEHGSPDRAHEADVHAAACPAEDGARAGVQPADDGAHDAEAAADHDDRVAGGAVQDAGGHAEEDAGDVRAEEGVSAEWTCTVDCAPRVCDSPLAVPCGAG